MFTKTLISLVALLALACTDPVGPTEDLEDLGKADSLSSLVVANHCEAFVDKAAIGFLPQSTSRFMQVYVKVINERLDGEVVRVGFSGGERICVSCGVGESGGPVFLDPLEVEATAFMGAADYFEMTLPVGVFDQDGQTLRLEGQLYVDTESGTRYTVRSEPEPYTVLDPDLPLPAWNADVSALDPIGWLDSEHPARRQLNPDGCL